MFGDRILICSILLTVSSATLSQQPAVNFDELEAAINEELKATNTPGAAVAVIIGDRVVFTRGFGVADVETKTPVARYAIPHRFDNKNADGGCPCRSCRARKNKTR